MLHSDIYSQSGEGNIYNCIVESCMCVSNRFMELLLAITR
jgi:hypothetical protein